MTVYRIRNWKQNFENNRTKELKIMTWVPMPNAHDGDSYARISERENGVAVYGAWALIVQIASKCTPRGTLVRNGAGAPIPHDPASLARCSRMRVRDFEAAIPVLLEVGWLEALTDDGSLIPQEGAAIPQEGAAIPQEGALNGMEWKGMEWKGMEGNGMKGTLVQNDSAREIPESSGKVGKVPEVSGNTKQPAGESDFERFWEAYPKKIGKKPAQKAWEKATDKPSIDELLTVIALWRQTDQWTKENGRFIPMPATWLNQARWGDELPPQGDQSSRDAAAARNLP